METRDEVDKLQNSRIGKWLAGNCFSFNHQRWTNMRYIERFPRGSLHSKCNCRDASPQQTRCWSRSIYFPSEQSRHCRWSTSFFQHQPRSSATTRSWWASRLCWPSTSRKLIPEHSRHRRRTRRERFEGGLNEFKNYCELKFEADWSFEFNKFRCWTGKLQNSEVKLWKKVKTEPLIAK